MIVVPTRRWLIGAGLLALAALPALRWPDAAGLLPALDLLWLAALTLDFALTPAPRTLEISREAPEPTPSSWVAWTRASASSGWPASPR